MKKILLAILALPLVGLGQISITGSGSSTQDFNTLANTGTTNSWSDNSTIPNWYAQRSGTGTTYTGNDGSSNAGTLYSYGTTSQTERSLGSIGSTNAAAGNFAYGVQLQNNAATNISGFSVSYTMEQWRNSGTTQNTLSFFYKVSSTLITALNPNSTAGWTAVTALNSTNPIAVSVAAALNGNDPANKVNLSNISIPGLILAPGEFLMLKWDDPDNAGSDHGLSIDDVTINYSASCESSSLITQTECDQFTLNAITYNASGIYQQVLPNANMFGCDSTINLDLTITSPVPYYEDFDLDGYGDFSVFILSCTPVAGYSIQGGDCNDNDPLSSPGTPEICNGLDDNCNGSVDEGATTIYYLDADGDNFGDDGIFTMDCIQPVGYAAVGGDCDDSDPLINPSATDIPGNGIDEDCSGADGTVAQIGIYEFTGAGACPNVSIDVTSQPAEAVFSAYSSTGTGCVATANVFNTDGWNTTSTIDLNEYNSFTLTANDCQLMTLSTLTFYHRNSGTGNVTWALRSSVDNYASNIASGQSSSSLSNQIVPLGSEFFNISSVTFRFYATDAATTGTTWRQDNVSLFGTFNTLTPQTYYADTDSDNYGDANTSISSCSMPAGYVLDNSDCDDNDFTINPETIWYEDVDGDLTGNTAVSFIGCTPPNSSYVQIDGDCDDNNATIINPTTYYIDADGDGFGSGDGTPLVSCTDPGIGYSTNFDDCDDAAFNVNPNSPEVCDGMDNNCNTEVDEGLTFTNYYMDQDNDGYGIGEVISACAPLGFGFALNDLDCNDDDNSINPGATDVLGDEIDQNCDGIDGYLGLDEINKLNVSIQPNPSNGIFLVQLNELTTATLTLTDLNGKNCKTFQMASESYTIDLSDLENGVYILSIKTENGSTQRRVVIQK